MSCLFCGLCSGYEFPDGCPVKSDETSSQKTKEESD